jgi:hypothetical protein
MFAFSKRRFSSRGFSIAESVIAVFLITLFIISVWEIYTLYLKISLANPAYFKASFLAEEGVEAIKFMRDSNWTQNISTLTPDTYYMIEFNGTEWQFSSTPVLIDGRFDRRVAFQDVFRDVSGNIVESGNYDPKTKKVNVEVSWYANGATTTRTISTYVSNIFNN